MAYNKIANQFTSIEQVSGQYLKNTPVKQSENKNSEVGFEEILKRKQEASETKTSSLKFSKHATIRMSSRNIEMTENQIERLENAVQKASGKGINESLILVDSLAFIVNVKNKTVVTAMNRDEADSNVFTNIDGAVIM